VGDYDRSNAVDGNDFLAWQRTFGSVADLNADGNNSRKVDAGDLEVWKNAYAAGTAPAASAVAPAVEATAISSWDAEPQHVLGEATMNRFETRALSDLTLDGLPLRQIVQSQKQSAARLSLMERALVRSLPHARHLRQTEFSAMSARADAAIPTKGFDGLAEDCNDLQDLGESTSLETLDAVFDGLQ
jgi:hypothetical protein